MKQTRRRWVDALFALLLITCLTLCFYAGWLSVHTGGWDTESEGYVIGRMYQMQRGLTQSNPAGFMGIYRDEVTHYTTADLFLQDAQVTPDIFWTYTHQTGLQGTAAGVMNLALCALKLPPQSRLAVLSFVNVWLFCVLLAGVCLWVYRELGFVAAALCCAGTLFSPWALCSMGNLYWAMWLYLLPFLLCAWLCRRYESADRLPRWVYPVVAGAVFLRFLCGFEFTSSVLICTEIPVVYYLLKHWDDTENRAAQRKKWLLTGLWLGLWCLVAFAAAMLTLFVQSMLHWGSLARGLEEIFKTVSFRTGAFRSTFNPPGVYGESLAVPLAEILRRYFTQETVTGGLTMGALMLMDTVWVALTAALFAVKKQTRLLLRSAKLFVVTLVAMLAPMSWFILARGHSSIHVGINYVLWLLPALPLLL
ncbi:MAG: hypothetical protein RSC36_08045, partial [Ruthenibacterium sp.]